MGSILANDVGVIFFTSQTIPTYKRGNNFNLGVQTTIENPKLKKKGSMQIALRDIYYFLYFSLPKLAVHLTILYTRLRGPSCKMIMQEECCNNKQDRQTQADDQKRLDHLDHPLG